ncbi:MAG: hypothetical protein HKN20_08185 [Gemmatimonadetes bacterium]|nr:hypothetical protein [Gemmatimonadota bacterium]
MTSSNRSRSSDWPELPFAAWSETAAHLHMLTQIAGKIRLVQTPWTNHSWHVPLYLTGRGLGTSLIPYDAKAFEIDFDFLKHELIVRTTDAERFTVPLEARPVADFYQEVMHELSKAGLAVNIHTTPSELPDGIPFEKDTAPRKYDGDAVQRFWRALLQIDRVFKEFRTRFIGKCSPVHFFWGSFDHAVTRFSGREAPAHPGGIPNFPDWVAREAYSHEVSSAGFWPGGGGVDHAAFYSYAYPGPEGFAEAPVRPAAAFFHKDLGEFVLPYDEVRRSDSPDDTLLAFLQSTYEAAADRANWDRPSLERTLKP